MKTAFNFRQIACAAIAACAMLSGCAKYRPSPLPTAPDSTKVPDVTALASAFLLPGLPPHPVPRNGLDELTVVTLAVFNNPDLKSARLSSGLAKAQILQAGLLPDPRLELGYATSALNYGGYIGFSQDVQSMILRGAAKSAAKAHRQQVDLNILWQEWQTAERARELFIQIRSDSAIKKVLNATRDLLAESYGRDRQAMERGNMTSLTVSADLVALTNSQTVLRQLQLQDDLARHELNHLLGVQPDVHLHLIGTTESAPLAQTDFQSAVAALPHRRVDLLALQAGYASQEQVLRGAILAQFPSLSVGLEEERDPVEGVNAFGPNVSIMLPLFNRNRGHIAIAKASRAVLRQTYQAQLDAAANQADQVWKQTQIMQGQLREINTQLPLLESTAAAAEESFRQGNLDAAMYVSMKSSLLSKQVEALRLRASLANAQSALDTLLGLPFSSP